MGWYAMGTSTFSRDEDGWWTAYVVIDDRVRVRYPLPIPFSATFDDAQFAFNALIARLVRLGVIDGS